MDHQEFPNPQFLRFGNEEARFDDMFLYPNQNELDLSRSLYNMSIGEKEKEGINKGFKFNQNRFVADLGNGDLNSNVDYDVNRFNVGEVENEGNRRKVFDLNHNGFVFGDCDVDLNGNVHYDVTKTGVYDGFDNRGFCNINDSHCQSSSNPAASFGFDDNGKCSIKSLHDGFQKGVCDSMRIGPFSSCCNSTVCSGSSWLNEQRRWEERNWSNKGIEFRDLASTTRPYLPESLASLRPNELSCNGADMVMNHRLHQEAYARYQAFSSMSKERTAAITKDGVRSGSPVSKKGEGSINMFTCDGSFILQENDGDYVSKRGRDLLRRQAKKSLNEIYMQNLKGKSSKLDVSAVNGSCETGQTLNGCCRPVLLIPHVTTLAKLRGHIHVLAQDQNGCRFLQEVLNDGTEEDVQTIFDEIREHVVDLIMNPFGNYVMQKFLEVCSEEQRLQVLLIVTQEPGQIAGICFNTYGTRVVQRLIETLKTRQQIKLVMSALKPGFLELIKDPNGNHVIQRCLQYLSNEDTKSIYSAAAKFCVEIATHRHGCCVMQRCIGYSTGQQRDKLITEVSRNALLLAQDPFGNYVVQYIIEQKNPSVPASLLSQFVGHYVTLSTQKFSSHVVEKCIKHFEESRTQIVFELLSVSHFEQLIQDPYANYVIQLALRTLKGPLHSLLVDAVERHKNLRTSPYCKRIFSKNLLRRMNAHAADA